MLSSQIYPFSAGMVNLGNTCYVNAAMCVFGSCKSVIAALESSKSPLAKTLCATLASMQAGITASPAPVLSHLITSHKPNEQHCVMELIEEISKVVTEVAPIFSVCRMTVVRCMGRESCEARQELEEQIGWHRLPVSELSLQDICRTNLTRIEIARMPGSCETCGSKHRLLETHVLHLPPVLLISINRYDQTGKCLTKVHCPHLLVFENPLRKYGLRCIVRHIGTNTEGGHYVSDIVFDQGFLHVDNETLLILPMGRDGPREVQTSVAVYEALED